MANNITFQGCVMPYTNAGAAIASGAAVLVGGKVGVAVDTIAASGGTGNLAMDIVVRYAKDVGAGTGGAQGAAAYWNNTSGKFTAASSGNTLAGYFWVTCLDAAATCSVKLLG